MQPSTESHRTEALRYLFWAFWFFLVPAVAAYGVILWLSANEALGLLHEAAREQSVPAGIVVFTLFDGLLWYNRHHLPLSSMLSPAGRAGVPSELRKEYEAAAHLLEEAERLIGKQRREIEGRLGAQRLEELEASLSELQLTLAAEPFEAARFSRAFAEAGGRVNEQLSPWRKGELREYAESIGVAILVALLLRAVVIEAFKIPSGSMKPTLQIGDHIFVSKFAYGPQIPFVGTRLFDSLPPDRGDVIVFKYPDPDPKAEPQDFIKRVIAIPGDVLEVDSGHPIVNGWRVPSCRAGRYTHEDISGFGRHSGELFVEFLGETAYLALYEEPHRPERQGPYRVRPGEVWVLGDNRHNSLDSRAWNRPAIDRDESEQHGAGVPFDNIKGRALIVWFPADRMLVNVMGKPVLPDDAPPELARAIERCLAERPPPSEATPPSPPP